MSPHWEANGDLAAVPVAIGLAGIIVLALIGSPTPLLSAGFLGGAAVLLGILALLGWAIRRGAKRVPRPANPIIRSALANLHRPGAATGSLVTALGFGLSAFVLLAAVQTSLDGNIQRSVPDRAPDYFVLDVPRDGLADFRAIIADVSADAQVDAVPTLRGAVVAYGPQDNMTVVADLEELPEGAWALRGERGITYSQDIPEGNSVIDGEWWSANYSGEPLVSIDEELAEAAGISVGDMLTISLLGVQRDCTRCQPAPN